MTQSRRTLPPLNALRAFEAAGRRLNFRAAAEELGVTQGAVAQQVRALEDQLGLRLFLRLSRGLALTAYGTGYLAEVSRAF
ncbi:MAG TPA: LysR family transcriptional regulator, partial [Allosphingosinicella sp.]